MNEKGSALITVILVVFVLTMVGIAGVLFMTMEDRLSGNAQMEKAGLYAAESGLRLGEKLIGDASLADPNAITTFLNPASTGGVASLAPPGGGWAAVPLVTGGTVYHAQLVPLAAGTRDQATFSLYVRNNADDASHSPTVNQDQKINLIAVGQLVSSGGTAVTKVIEEQMDAAGAGGGLSLQKGLNFGSTGAVGIK